MTQLFNFKNLAVSTSIFLASAWAFGQDAQQGSTPCDELKADFEIENKDVTLLDNEVQFTNTSTPAHGALWEFDFGHDMHTWDVSNSFPADEPGAHRVRLTIYGEGGCTDTISKVVRVKEELMLFVPNAFSPNGDLTNDIFLPVFGSGYSPFGYELLIYNKTGQIVFESHDQNVGWNGTFGQDANLPCADGVYVWRMTVKTSMDAVDWDIEHVYQGHIVLVQ